MPVLSEGRGRLYSPTLKEFIDMVPEVVTAPVNRHTAKQVARCIEYDGHANQRGHWACLEEGMDMGGDDASELYPRFGHHLPAKGGYGEPGGELLVVLTS